MTLARRFAAPSAIAALALSAVLTGCGSSAADLFTVTRTPVSGGGASSMPVLTLAVRDDGTVTCNGRRRPLPGSLLLDARQLQRDLDGAATRGEVLAPGPRPVYSYSARTPAGSVSFADDSRGAPNVFQRLAYFTLQVERRACSAAPAA